MGWPRADAGTVVLTGAAVLLALCIALVLFTEQETATAVPAPARPAPVTATGPVPAAAPPVASSPVRPAAASPTRVARDPAPGATAARAMPPQAGGAPPQVGGTPPWGGGTSQDPAGFDALLDRVFAPERARRGRAAAPADESSPRGVSWRPEASGLTVAVDASPTTGEREAGQARAGTEKAYYESFMDLARRDPGALLEQADAVIAGDAEDCRKVAMLRALFDTDQRAAAPHFLRAIATLPDRAQGGSVSVPAFAITHLGRRATDPGLRTAIERLAWAGELPVEPPLRQLAASTLLATASDADRRRFAAYPHFRAPEPMAEVER